jgi:drug/metabolite transporter (DMT)-like permease
MTQANDDNIISTSGNVFLGSFYICISATMFAIAAAAVKLALEDLQPLQLVLWRNFLSLIIFVSWSAIIKPDVFRDLKTQKLNLHIVRSVLSLFVLYSYFFAVAHIKLATAVLLLSTSPVFVPMIALIWLGYRVSATVWIGIFIAFFGVSLIIDPTFTYKVQSESYFGLVAGLLAGCFGGAATVAIWKMSKSEPPDRQMIYFTAISFIASLPAGVYGWHWPMPKTFVPIVALGIATTLAQYYLAKGCSVAPADKINTWNYLSIVISAIAAYFGWNESLGLWTILGMVLVVVGAQLASLSRVEKHSRLSRGVPIHRRAD